MTAWIYVDTSRQIGDDDQLKALATDEAANAWVRRARSGGRGVRVSD
jgi:hypothetical protein